METRRPATTSAAQEDKDHPVHLPELGSELIIEIVSLNQRIKSVLAGMDDNLFVLARLSANDLIGTFRSESVTRSQAVVRFRRGDVVYGFNSEVQNIVTVPCKLMFLAYPKKIERVLADSEARYRCLLPGMTMVDNEIIELVIVDVSRQGCQCVIKASGARNDRIAAILHVNTKLEVRTQFPGTVERFSFPGIVRNISKDSDKINIGMVFEGLPPDVKLKFEHFILTISEKSKA